MYIPVTPAFRKRQNCKFNATMYENRWKTLQCALSAYDIGTSVHNPFQHVKALDHVEEAPQKVNVASVYGTEKTWIVKTRQKQQQQKTPKGIVLKMHFPLKQINSEWGSRSCWGLDFQEAGGVSHGPFSAGAVEGGSCCPHCSCCSLSSPPYSSHPGPTFLQLRSTPRVRTLTKTQTLPRLRKFSSHWNVNGRGS